MEYETDPSHVDLICKSLELADSKPVLSPGAKNPVPELEADKTNPSDNSATMQKSSDNGPNLRRQHDVHEQGAPLEPIGEPLNILDMFFARSD